MPTSREVVDELYAIGELIAPALRQRYMAAVADVRQLLDTIAPEDATPEEVFLRLAGKAELIIEQRDIDEHWCDVYGKLFSPAISGAMHDTGLTEAYYDPDTSYEDDVAAFMAMVRPIARRLLTKED